jgi:hypothetical protein
MECNRRGHAGSDPVNISTRSAITTRPQTYSIVWTDPTTGARTRAASVTRSLRRTIRRRLYDSRGYKVRCGERADRNIQLLHLTLIEPGIRERRLCGHWCR